MSLQPFHSTCPAWLLYDCCHDMDPASWGGMPYEIAVDFLAVHSQLDAWACLVFRVAHFYMVSDSRHGAFHAVSLPFGGDAWDDSHSALHGADSQEELRGRAVDP